jgi:hypothetical protein
MKKSKKKKRKNILSEKGFKKQKHKINDEERISFNALGKRMKNCFEVILLHKEIVTSISSTFFRSYIL